MATSQSAYRAPLWLPGGNLQTLYPALLARRPAVSYRRQRWDTPDGDFIDLDWTAAPAASDAPLLVLFHGLEGSSNSHYARALMHAAAQRGWQGVVVHFRGCSGELNRLPRAYHSGDSAEIGWILERLGARYSVGISLGGNALLKYLGEQGSNTAIRRAVAISAPDGYTLLLGINALAANHTLYKTGTVPSTVIRCISRRCCGHR